jgi:hypothetical protein
VAADGHREVLGFAVGDSEDGAFWTAFLRTLKARGLHGVQLVISDAHEGLKAAISAVLLGAAWQRCRVTDRRYRPGWDPGSAADRAWSQERDPTHNAGQLLRGRGRLRGRWYRRREEAGPSRRTT